MSNTINPFFTLKTTQQENEFIRFVYEEDRKKRLVAGSLPSSLSRFLVDTILRQLKSERGADNG